MKHYSSVLVVFSWNFKRIIFKNVFGRNEDFKSEKKQIDKRSSPEEI